MRWHLARRLEKPPEELSEVTFCSADRIAKKMIEAAENAPDEIAVDIGKKLLEATYGTKAEVADMTPRPTRSEAEQKLAQALLAAGIELVK